MNTRSETAPTGLSTTPTRVPSGMSHTWTAPSLPRAASHCPSGETCSRVTPSRAANVRTGFPVARSITSTADLAKARSLPSGDRAAVKTPPAGEHLLPLGLGVHVPHLEVAARVVGRVGAPVPGSSRCPPQVTRVFPSPDRAARA